MKPFAHFKTSPHHPRGFVLCSHNLFSCLFLSLVMFSSPPLYLSCGSVNPAGVFRGCSAVAPEPPEPPSARSCCQSRGTAARYRSLRSLCWTAHFSPHSERGPGSHPAEEAHLGLLVSAIFLFSVTSQSVRPQVTKVTEKTEQKNRVPCC